MWINNWGFMEVTMSLKQCQSLLSVLMWCSELSPMIWRFGEKIHWDRRQTKQEQILTKKKKTMQEIEEELLGAGQKLCFYVSL